MSGVHDVGGKPGYGAPKFKGAAGKTVFAARWEASVFAMMQAVGALGVTKNTDQFRHAVERVNPEAYYAHGYYGRWLGGLETLLIEAHRLDRDTVDARVGELAKALGATQPQIDTLVADVNVASRPRSNPDLVEPAANPLSSIRYLPTPPRFIVGERVRAIGLETAEQSITVHTRLPDYASGCVGEVIAWHCGWVLPDTNAHGRGEQPSHLYTVAFGAQELYGADAEANVSVRLDLFEPYLENDAD